MYLSGNLNFHQTFRPESRYIGELVLNSDQGCFLSIRDISSMTGIPTGESSGKVEPHILYSHYMGLIDFDKGAEGYLLRKTPLGECVLNEDPGLQEELTLWLCHGMLLRDHGADMWNAFFRSILPKYRGSIKRETALRELQSVFGDKVTTKNIAPLFASYSDLFAPLRIVSLDDETVWFRSVAPKAEFVYVYAYLLLEYWDERFPGEAEITADQLSSLNFQSAFCWDAQAMYSVLEWMSDKSLIRLNRQLSPFTIVRLIEKDVLTPMLYSELC